MDLREDAARRMIKALREHAQLLKADATTWFAVLVGAITLTVSDYHASTTEYQEQFGKYAGRGGWFAVMASSLHLTKLSHWLATATGPIADYVYWFLSSDLLFVALPFAVAAAIPGVRIREFGIGLGDWRYGLKALALLYFVMLPFVVGASMTSTFANEYPMAASATQHWSTLVVYELTYMTYFVGWEFIYRGVLSNGLHPRFGVAAILLPIIPFAIMHAGKPEAEAYGAIVAGIALGVVAVRARSFWYGAALHASIAFTMDMLALAHTHRWPRH